MYFWPTFQFLVYFPLFSSVSLFLELSSFMDGICVARLNKYPQNIRINHWTVSSEYTHAVKVSLLKDLLDWFMGRDTEALEGPKVKTVTAQNRGRHSESESGPLSPV